MAQGQSARGLHVCASPTAATYTASAAVSQRSGEREQGQAQLARQFGAAGDAADRLGQEDVRSGPRHAGDGQREGDGPDTTVLRNTSYSPVTALNGASPRPARGGKQLGPGVDVEVGYIPLASREKVSGLAG
ncbi:hypothetical protein [Streptomyces goshikiensis]|uniref:hypothetical protein n=1 Tax=Streptomyces goshikiensis TaxID=1942 RepID=UPI0036682712